MDTQEIMTTALRKEAANALQTAAYEITHKDAGIEQVREQIGRALKALEMSLPNITLRKIA